ncbi:type III secretion protein O [Methylomarinovum tepidoasis]|uniref:Type III secretion protein O n=2 Tax=Methylomarinovum tepidoasis TaxID=2840183 RepID=A0AAU9CT53_9GAMM|nr:type III secretion protein O [Methylomarinovum sp. IN45]
MTWGQRLRRILREIRGERRRWRRERETDLLALRRRQVEVELDLEAEKRRRQLHLEQELERMRRQFELELTLLEKKQEQDLRDYERYLAAVDQLQVQLRHAFSQAPEVIVLTLHHHAKRLLDRMWEAEDLQQRLQREQEFVKFLTTVYEDTLQATTTEGTEPLLPRRALRLMLHTETDKET